MAEMSNLLGKITDPMTIMIRVVGLTVRCFWFLWEFLGFTYFLECSPRILGGFTWVFKRRLQLVIVRKILPTIDSTVTQCIFTNESKNFCSFGCGWCWFIMREKYYWLAGADLRWEKSTAGWLDDNKQNYKQPNQHTTTLSWWRVTASFIVLWRHGCS